jgi:hypothetical protein
LRSADGRTFTIDEFREFMQIESFDGKTEEVETLGELRNGRHPVNEVEGDPNAFDVFTGGLDPVRCLRV